LWLSSERSAIETADPRRMIVVDASVMVEALGLREHVQDRLVDEDLHAPHLLDAEVAQALRTMLRRGTVTQARASAALADLAQIELDRHGHQDLLPRVWELRDNLTAYDALYVALAEQLGCALVTLDRRLAGMPGQRVTVEVLAPG